MTELRTEVAWRSLSKHNEELCGDNVESVFMPDRTLVVLSDGLGSGVKANILATLTTRIAVGMLRRDIPLEEVVDTISQTLPICKVRKIAYSTFHIIETFLNGQTVVVEFDCPPTFLLRQGRVVPFPTQKRTIGGKEVRLGRLLLQTDDLLVAVSDGVIHAGIGGGLLKLGWGWQGVAEYLAREITPNMSAWEIATTIINCCNGYYAGRVGDDTTVVAIKVRRPRVVTVLTGPPANPHDDTMVVKRFLAHPGRKVIAGGTTAHIVSRYIGSPVRVNLEYPDPEVPPTAFLEGVDLVTEGVLTLTKTVEKLAHARHQGELAAQRQDGATLLAKMLLASDDVHLMVGKAINPAHQNPNLPRHIGIKTQIIERLAKILTDRGKKVAIEWY